MEIKSKEVDELKLSNYSLKLCKEVQIALPHISNVRAMKRLANALNEYLKAYQKLGGKIE